MTVNASIFLNAELKDSGLCTLKLMFNFYHYQANVEYD